MHCNQSLRYTLYCVGLQESGQERRTPIYKLTHVYASRHVYGEYPLAAVYLEKKLSVSVKKNSIEQVTNILYVYIRSYLRNAFNLAYKMVTLGNTIERVLGKVGGEGLKPH